MINIRAAAKQVHPLVGKPLRGGGGGYRPGHWMNFFSASLGCAQKHAFSNIYMCAVVSPIKMVS